MVGVSTGVPVFDGVVGWLVSRCHCGCDRGGFVLKGGRFNGWLYVDFDHYLSNVGLSGRRFLIRVIFFDDLSVFVDEYGYCKNSGNFDGHGFISRAMVGCIGDPGFFDVLGSVVEGLLVKYGGWFGLDLTGVGCV